MTNINKSPSFRANSQDTPGSGGRERRRDSLAGPSHHNVPSGVPLMLSEKYKRTHKVTIAHLMMQDNQSLGEDEFIIAPVQTTEKGGGQQRKQSEDSIDTIQEKVSKEVPLNSKAVKEGGQKEGSGSSNGNNSDDKPAGGEDEHQPVDDFVYEPFALKATSSFSPSQVTERQLMRMDPRLRAKYQAYVKPPQSLQEKIGASERRARKWLAEKHKETQALNQEAKRKWDLLHRAIEDPLKKNQGQKFAAEAKARIKSKKDLKKAFRESELQHLVEGQSNSIDAIQLKEYLAPSTLKLPKTKPYTSREKARLEELLSMELKL